MTVKWDELAASKARERATWDESQRRGERIFELQGELAKLREDHQFSLDLLAQRDREDRRLDEAAKFLAEGLASSTSSADRAFAYGNAGDYLRSLLARIRAGRP